MPDELARLAELTRVKNEADLAIAQLIGRPCERGNIGEFVAARVFAMRLMASGSHPVHDGVFEDEDGPPTGKTVNVKTYGRHESVLDIGTHPCDYSLVMTGPPGQARTLPWVIDSVFLFDQERLLNTLRARGVKIGAATSVRKADWEAARIFPSQGKSLSADIPATPGVASSALRSPACLAERAISQTGQVTAFAQVSGLRRLTITASDAA